jgi:hypothetical protein
MTASFYKTVYQRKFEELPNWKRLAIVEDSERNHWSGILTDFVKAVIEEAEKEYANSKSPKTVADPTFWETFESKPKKTSKKKS